MKISKITGFVNAGEQTFAICRDAKGQQFIVEAGGQRVSKKKLFTDTIRFIDSQRRTIHAKR